MAKLTLYHNETMDPFIKAEVSAELKQLGQLLGAVGRSMHTVWQLTWRWQAWLTATAVSLGLAIATLTGFIPLLAPTSRLWRRLNWAAELTSHLRPHYALVLFLLALLFAWYRRYGQAGLAALFAVINLALVVPLYLPAATPSAQAAANSVPTYRAVMLNVYTDGNHYDEVLAFLEEAQPDVIVMTEVLQGWRSAMKPLLETYPYSNRKQAKDYSGAVIFSRFPLAERSTFQPVAVTADGRPTVTAMLNIDGQLVRLVGTHPRSPQSVGRMESRNLQMVTLGEWLRQHPGTTLLLGDLNASPWSSAFRELVGRSGLRNGRLGFGLQATWPASAGIFGLPIDHALVSDDIEILNLESGSNVGSDHRPLIVDFSLNTVNTP